MVDDPRPAATPSGSICPWCSASYAGDPETCPSCGAALAVDPATDPALPGLTAIDAAAIVRAKAPVARPRNRLLSWISGDYGDEAASATDPGALAPPDLEVRREMLRLELAAEVANLQAEADALIADAAYETGGPLITAQSETVTMASDGTVAPTDAVAVPPVDAAPEPVATAGPVTEGAASVPGTEGEPFDEGQRPA
jgi:hypothetical protein